MKRNFLFSACLSLAISLSAYSQNAVITYSTLSNLCDINVSRSCCNTFNLSPNTFVGGYRHYPVSGGATYTNSTSSINLQTRYTTNVDSGTAYAIQYPFKTGYNYLISITMYHNSPGWQPKVRAGLFVNSLPNPVQSNPTACGAVPYNNYSHAFGTFFAGEILAYNAPSTQYFFPQFSVPFVHNFLSLVVYYGSNIGTTASIQQVTITETPIFTLSPVTVTKVCGSALTQNFTVNDLAGVGANSITWNLGAVPNGWTYLGNPAPATITTLSNTITLSSGSCDIPKNISAQANRASGNIQTNTSVVIRANPSLEISGSPSLCSGQQQYIINNIPCGGTVSWSISPSGPASMSSSGNQATLNFNSSGNVVLQAIVTLPCTSSPMTLYKEIVVGVPIANNFPISGPPVLCTNAQATYSTPFYAGVTYNWTTSGFNSGGGPGPQCTVTATPFPGAGQLILNLSNVCGNVPNPPTMFVNIQNCFKNFLVSPNPATDMISVRLNTKNNTIPATGKQVMIYQVKITDSYGTVRASKQFREGQSNVDVPVANLPSGIYLLSIYNGKNWETQQIVVK